MGRIASGRLKTIAGAKLAEKKQTNHEKKKMSSFFPPPLQTLLMFPIGGNNHMINKLVCCLSSIIKKSPLKENSDLSLITIKKALLWWCSNIISSWLYKHKLKSYLVNWYYILGTLKVKVATSSYYSMWFICFGPSIIRFQIFPFKTKALL